MSDGYAQWCAKHVNCLDQGIKYFCEIFFSMMRTTVCIHLKPFNDRTGHYSGSCIFGYNSAPAAAREVFKPSTDSASLVVSSQKKKFQFWFRGSRGGRHKWGCFRVFMAYFDRPWTPIEWAHIFDRIFS